MKKILKSWGKGIGIYFDKEDIKIYKMKIGDAIDLEFCKVKNKKGGILK